MPRFVPVPDPRYPAIEPFDHGFLAVDSGHQIYWEACGNPDGLPILFLHGGPGGGCNAASRRFFDPSRYQIILFDQRGCGKSTPAGSLESNTTAHLIADIESLRQHLRIEKWLLFGGSWGATLALAYAEQFPLHVTAMVLRAAFAARQSELDWLYRNGAANIFAEAWMRFQAFIPEVERGDLIRAYQSRLTCGDAMIENAAARMWCLWEDALTTLLPSPLVADAGEMRTLARIEAHYFINSGFIEGDELIARCQRLRDIPGIIVQGRYDCVTPPATAWAVHRVWPGSRLDIIDGAGHASSEPGISEALVAATDYFAAKFGARRDID